MLDTLVYYRNCNAESKTIYECSVTGYLESTRDDSGKAHCNYFFLQCVDVESNPRPTVSYKYVLALTKNVSKTSNSSS